jgi:hypothetical protein
MIENERNRKFEKFNHIYLFCWICSTMNFFFFFGLHFFFFFLGVCESSRVVTLTFFFPYSVNNKYALLPIY